MLLGCKWYYLADYVTWRLLHLFSLDVFEAFSYVVEKHDLKDHPGIKAVMMIGGLIAKAACDETLDG